MMDLGERKVSISIKAKWLQLAGEKGFPDVDAYFEDLQNALDKKHLQYEQMLSTRDKLYSTITEAAALLKEIQEAIQQQKDLKIFLSKIEEYLEKNKDVIL